MHSRRRGHRRDLPLGCWAVRRYHLRTERRALDRADHILASIVDAQRAAIHDAHWELTAEQHAECGSHDEVQTVSFTFYNDDAERHAVLNCEAELPAFVHSVRYAVGVDATELDAVGEAVTSSERIAFDTPHDHRQAHGHHGTIGSAIRVIHAYDIDLAVDATNSYKPSVIAAILSAVTAANYQSIRVDLAVCAPLVVEQAKRNGEPTSVVGAYIVELSHPVKSAVLAAERAAL